MQMKLRNCAIVFLMSTIVLVSEVAANYLADKPNFLTPCALNTPSFGKCFAANFQVLFHEWGDGVPGLKSVGAIDPLQVKRVKIAHEASQTLAINADLKNVFVKGAKSAVIEEATFDSSHYVSKFNLLLPKLRFEFDYKLKGRVLALNLNGQGNGYFDTEKLSLAVQINMKPRSEHGQTFTDVESIKVAIREIKGFHIQLNNLFNGQKDLEESTNELFNTNWREFYEILKPATEQIIESVLTDRLKKTFAYVPASYFVENIQ